MFYACVWVNNCQPGGGDCLCTSVKGKRKQDLESFLLSETAKWSDLCYCLTQCQFNMLDLLKKANEEIWCLMGHTDRILDTKRCSQWTVIGLMQWHFNKAKQQAVIHTILCINCSPH